MRKEGGEKGEWKEGRECEREGGSEGGREGGRDCDRDRE